MQDMDSTTQNAAAAMWQKLSSRVQNLWRKITLRDIIIFAILYTVSVIVFTILAVYICNIG